MPFRPAPSTTLSVWDQRHSQEPVMIRVLFLGDIVGRAARQEVIEQAPALREEHDLVFLVVLRLLAFV